MVAQSCHATDVSGDSEAIGTCSLKIVGSLAGC